MEVLRKFSQTDSGATAMEYGLILGLAGLLAFTAFYVFYDQLSGLFSRWAAWFASPDSSIL